MVPTCNLCGDAAGHWWPEPFVGAGLNGEEVGGAWVESHKEVVGLITELEDTATLSGQLCVGVQGAEGLVGDLRGSGFCAENNQHHTANTTAENNFASRET